MLLDIVHMGLMGLMVHMGLMGLMVHMVHMVVGGKIFF